MTNESAPYLLTRFETPGSKMTTNDCSNIDLQKQHNLLAVCALDYFEMQRLPIVLYLQPFKRVNAYCNAIF